MLSFAGARNFGSAKPKAGAPVVGAVALPGGTGYRLLYSDGGLQGFGSAIPLAQPSAHPHAGRFVAAASTPEGAGLWALTAGGSVINVGDAPFCGSPVHHLGTEVAAGIVPTPDGRGYWVFTAQGTIDAYGDAAIFGNAPASAVGANLVGLAPTADGKGYWLAFANGQVLNFGDAVTMGSLGTTPKVPIVGIAAPPSGKGYWLVNAVGEVFSFGVSYHGGLTKPPPKGVSVVALVPTTAAPKPAPVPSKPTPTTTTTLPAPKPTPVTPLKGNPYTHGAIGYDVSSYQCKKKQRGTARTGLPPHTGLAVIAVAGWLDSAMNPCLSSELSWAKGAAVRHDPQSLYLFLNAPTRTVAAARQDAAGPAGKCASLRREARGPCRAYNYGYNGALTALRYSAAHHVSAPLWWLDIEGGRSKDAYAGHGAYWSKSKGLNDLTIQGAIDALRRYKITVGFYSSSVQYGEIAGHYVPKGPRMPLWVAGVPWTKPPYHTRGLPSPAILKAWCNGTAKYARYHKVDVFAGGAPWLLQETPGPRTSPYGVDPDVAC